MQAVDKKFVKAFKAEAKRQEDFTNSFWRQLAVILVSIVLINIFGPPIILYGTNITSNFSFF